MREIILRIASPLLVLVLGIVLFAGTLDAPFTGDDFLIATDSPQGYDPTNALKYFFHDFDLEVPEELEEMSDTGDQQSRFGLYRPILVATFISDTLLWHQKPFGWRLSNLILHLAASLLVLGLATNLLGSRLGGLAAALLFVAHPIHIEAVASLLSGRAEMLAFIFLASSWWLFLLGDRRSGTRRWTFDIGSAVFFLFGLWSKENAVVLPGILALAGWSLRNHSIKSLVVRLVPHIVVFCIYAAIRLSVIGGVTTGDWSWAFGDASAAQIFLTMMTVMALYLRLTLLPYPLLHPECYDNLPKTVTVVEGIFSAVLVFGLLGVAAWQVIRNRQRGRLCLWAFGLLFFYWCLVPVSHVVPFRVVMGARFLYLPSLALCVLIGHLCVKAYHYRRWLPAVIGVPLLAACSMHVLLTNTAWVKPERLYASIAECNPESPGPHISLGVYRLRQGRVAESIPFFRKAAMLDPLGVRPYYNLAYALQLLNKPREAEEVYRQVLALAPDHSRTLNNLGLLLQARGDLAQAKELFERAVRADPRHPYSVVNLGNLEQAEGDYERAEKHFRLALRIAPRLVEARFNLGRLLKQTGRLKEAEQEYNRILEFYPDHTMTHNSLGNLLKDRRQFDQAKQHYQAAIRSDPNYAPAHYNLANTLLTTGDADGAAKHFTIALKLQPDKAEALIGLGWARLQLGQLYLAREAAHAAARLAPYHPSLRELLNILQRKQGD